MRLDDPRHGKYAGWQQHSKDGDGGCEPCRDARYLYVKRMKLRLARGVRVRVPLGDEAYVKLTSSSVAQMARATGMKDTTIHHVIHGGPTGTVYEATRVKILAANIAFTPIGIQRRTRALARIGYSAAEVAREVGCSVDAIRKIRRSPKPPTFVRHEFGLTICWAFDRLAMSPAPSSRAATRARAEAESHDWRAPLAWDDDTIDDPTAKPHGASRRTSKTDVDPVVVERVLSGDRLPMTTAERREVVGRARGLGWSEEQIRVRTGIAKAADPTRYGVAS